MSILYVSDTEKDQEFSKIVIDKEKLISLIESRPVIWDKNLDIYKDKAAKAAAWGEICTSFMDNYEELAPKDKHDFGRFVTKKWSQTRDSWIRSLIEEKTCKGTPSKPYRYHKQMLFLRGVVRIGDYHTGSSKTKFVNERTQNDQESSRELRTRHKALKTSTEKATDNRKRKHEDDENIRIINYHKAKNSNRFTDHKDRNLTFFKSLLPSLALLDDDQTLEFQSGVIRLLQSIKRRPAFYEWDRRQSQGSISQSTRDQCPSPSADSTSTRSSDVSDPLHRFKVEIDESESSK